MKGLSAAAMLVIAGGLPAFEMRRRASGTGLVWRFRSSP
jgi:hypothetical protein